MDRDDIIRMAKEAEAWSLVDHDGIAALERFADLVAAAEREKVAHWMMTACYATGHGDTTEDLLRELGWQIEEKIAREREACAKACDKLGDEYADANAADCAFAIRERGAP